LFLYFIRESLGLNHFYFHLYSLLLHSANGILLFLIIKKLLPFCTQKLFIAFFTTFLFLLHPLQIETVAWVSASKWLLVTFFMLLGILFYLQLRLHSLFTSGVCSAACFVLALLSKEIAVIFPLLLLIIELFFLKSGSLYIKRVLPFLIISVFFGIFTLYIPVLKPGLQALKVESPFTIVDNIYLSVCSLGNYIFFIFVPLYRPATLAFLSGSENILPNIIAVFLFATCVCIFCFSKSKVLVGCFLFFIINVFFSLPIIPASRAGVIADRYVYIAGIGLFGGIVYFISKQKKWAKISLGVYLMYLIIIALAESVKWVKVLS